MAAVSVAVTSAPASTSTLVPGGVVSPVPTTVVCAPPATQQVTLIPTVVQSAAAVKDMPALPAPTSAARSAGPDSKRLRGRMRKEMDV
jgi:hypothetical protein